MSQYLYGMHDPGGEHLFADKKGWIVFTESVGFDANDKTGRDYTQWSSQGYGVLVRVNNAYGSGGTIPEPQHYDDFAMRVSNYIAASRGCNTWIIGNECNHSAERPNGQPITSAMYIDCFKRIHAQVRLMSGTRHGLIPVPVALWNVETGDWLEYQEAIWRGLSKLSAGVAIHTYSHGASPALITSQEKMGAPYQNRFYHFQAYRNLMIRVPVEMRGLPAYITETDQNDPWVDANTGWVQAAYAEIDRWNKTDGTQKIHCMCLYRWPSHDQWCIANKPGVHQDLRAAVSASYLSPNWDKDDMTETLYIPTVSPGTVAAPDLPPREWDERLTARGVTIETPPLAPGQPFWRVVKARWYDEQEADALGPDHHIMADVLDYEGRRVVGTALRVEWPTGDHEIWTEAKPGEPYSANYPMSPSRNEFSVRVTTGIPSEVLKGIGMGADTPSGFNAGIHTSTGVVFQRATMPATAPTPSIEAPQPAPVEPLKEPTGDTWTRSREFVRRWEGDYTNDPRDHGNWTGGKQGVGELKGSKYGISAASYPDLDIVRLTLADADAIYFRDYWQASGADKLPWPYCLLAFDTAVLHGVVASRKWQVEAGNNALAFAAKRLRVYTNLDNWHAFGAGWVNRVSNLLEEASK